MLCRFGLASSRISVIGGITVPMADDGWTGRSPGNRRRSSVVPTVRGPPPQSARCRWRPKAEVSISRSQGPFHSRGGISSACGLQWRGSEAMTTSHIILYTTVLQCSPSDASGCHWPQQFSFLKPRVSVRHPRTDRVGLAETGPGLVCGQRARAGVGNHPQLGGCGRRRRWHQRWQVWLPYRRRAEPLVAGRSRRRATAGPGPNSMISIRSGTISKPITSPTKPSPTPPRSNRPSMMPLPNSTASACLIRWPNREISAMKIACGGRPSPNSDKPARAATVGQRRRGSAAFTSATSSKRATAISWAIRKDDHRLRRARGAVARNGAAAMSQRETEEAARLQSKRRRRGRGDVAGRVRLRPPCNCRMRRT